jgi:hypothetical protein
VAPPSPRPSSILLTIASNVCLSPMTKCRGSPSGVLGKERCRCLDFSLERSVSEERGYCWTGVCACIDAALQDQYDCVRWMQTVAITQSSASGARTLSLSLAKKSDPLPTPSVPFFFFFLASSMVTLQVSTEDAPAWAWAAAGTAIAAVAGAAYEL